MPWHAGLFLRPSPQEADIVGTRCRYRPIRRIGYRLCRRQRYRSPCSNYLHPTAPIGKSSSSPRKRKTCAPRINRSLSPHVRLRRRRISSAQGADIVQSAGLDIVFAAGKDIVPHAATFHKTASIGKNLTLLWKGKNIRCAHERKNPYLPSALTSCLSIVNSLYATSCAVALQKALAFTTGL